jgi:hypothetical protein
VSKIDELRSLVEEVRNIVNADAATEDAEAREAVYQEAADEIADEVFEASAHKPGAHHGDASSHAAHAGRSKGRAAARDDGGKPMKGKFKKRTGRSPFKRSRVLGPAKTGVAKPTKRTFRGYWKCRKVGAYKQLCLGSEGERKTVHILKAYKKKYNKAYRRYRAKHQSKFGKGKWIKKFG